MELVKNKHRVPVHFYSTVATPSAASRSALSYNSRGLEYCNSQYHTTPFDPIRAEIPDAAMWLSRSNRDRVQLERIACQCCIAHNPLS
jgi:hypothetical protein